MSRLAATEPAVRGRTAGDSPARLIFLDSMRGVAAVYVLLFHLLFVSGLGALVPSWARAFVMNGGSGVTLFFVVSAFSLCHAHAEGFRRRGSIVEFFIRRAARILPLFYVMLAFTLIRNAQLHIFPHPAGQILRTALLVFNLVPEDEDGIVPAAWSIGVEVLFYAAFPWLFPRVQTLPRLALAIVLSLGAAALFHLFVQTLPYPPSARSSYYSASLPRRMPVFLLGIGTWIVFRRRVYGAQSLPWRGAALIALSAALYAAYIHGVLTFAWPEPYYAEAVVYALLLIALGIWPAWPLVSRATAFCGRISYSIYLLHVPMMTALAPAYGIIKQWPLPGGFIFAVCLALTLACLLPVATLSYVVVEKTGMRAGKLLSRRAGRNAVPS